MGWLQDDARIAALIYRDGKDLWRDLKLAIRTAVDEYNRIYCEPGHPDLSYNGCEYLNDDCARVRIIPQPPGREEVSYEIMFLPDERRIQGLNLDLGVEGGKVVLKAGGEMVTIEEASRTMLKPLLSRLPPRQPNITL
jgi:hypothetical protein